MATSSAAQIPRIPWTPAEDAELKRAVAVHGDKRWSQISTYLPGRTSKACSHRWRTYLQPGVMHASSVPFSQWEKAVVKEAHRAVGNNWAVIARMLPGRTNAAVKNFWYSYKRRIFKAQGRRLGTTAAAAAATAAAAGTNSNEAAYDDTTDSEADAEGVQEEVEEEEKEDEAEEEGEEDDDLGSADEMDFEDGYEDDCEDDDMADDSFLHNHTMEGVDCSATWQVAAAGMHGAAAGIAGTDAAAAAAGWLQPKQEPLQGPVVQDFLMTPQGHTAMLGGQFDTAHADTWSAQAAAAGVEAHGSSGGTDSSLLTAQQQQQQLVDGMRSCVPRRSSHHSWSGTPRSLPAAAGGAGGGDVFSSPAVEGGMSGPAAWDLQAAAAAAVAQFDPISDASGAGLAAAEEAAAAGDGVPVRRVCQPRISGHGHYLEPQQLGARASARYISSTQLFDLPAAALPFGELHSRQITTSNQAGAGAAGPYPGQNLLQAHAHSKAFRFALDLSAIHESEPDIVGVKAEAGAGLWPPAQQQTEGLQPQQGMAGSHGGCAASSLAAGSSGQSTVEELHGWHAEQQAAALAHTHSQQPPGAAGGVAHHESHGQQQQQQQQVLLPGREVEQQGAGGMCCLPPRKLVRPSLCSDAGTAGPQQQRMAAAAHASGAAADPAQEQGACVPEQSRLPGRSGSLLPMKRRFVLDLSDP